MSMVNPTGLAHTRIPIGTSALQVQVKWQGGEMGEMLLLLLKHANRAACHYLHVGPLKE
jgi:hypothetical protein